MNTFRRYLFSYIGLLLIPLIILSAVVLNIVQDYCSRELVSRNTMLLEQLGSMVSLELDQIDSYALETSHHSIFYHRNQARVGTIYGVQHFLSSWSSACGFVNRIDYVNSKRGKYYTISSVNDFDSYYALYFGDDSIGKECFRDAVFQNTGRRWITVKPDLKHRAKLVYLSSARISSVERNTLICTIDTELLDQMISDIVAYEEYITFISAEDGSVLYTNSKNIQHTPEASDFLLPDKASGQLQTDGIQYTYSRVTGGHGLTYVSAIPTTVINRPLYSLWNGFYWALGLIALLGIVGIYQMMKRNWLPIKQLHDTVVGDNQEKHDEVQAVQQAVLSLQEQTKQISRANRLYAQDRLIYRLLLGGFDSVADFNIAAEAYNMGLRGESWKLMLMRFDGNESSGEADHAGILRNALPDALMLEVPEKTLLIALIPTDKEDEMNQAIEILASRETRCWVSKPCCDIKDIVKAWRKLLLRISKKDDEGFTAYDPSSISGLRDALNLGEAEQTLFSFNMLLAEHNNLEHLRSLAYDVMYLFQSKLILLKRFGEAEQIRQIGLSIMQLTDSELDHIHALLQQAMELIYQQLMKQENTQDAMILQINTYLENQYSDPELTIGMVAEHFGISGSNLSHYYKSRTGSPVSEKLQELRMTEAVRLLTNTDMGITAIAAQCGYAQPATFMRVFKKLMRETPSEYRNSHVHENSDC